MAGSKKPVVPCVGSPQFDPPARAKDADARAAALAALEGDDFAAAIRTWFQLPAADAYAYHAITTVTLAQAQHAVSLGRANGLHAWYAASPPPEEETAAGEEPPPPPPPPPTPDDVEAYVAVFRPSSLAASALRALGANAKKGSVRARAAAHLAARRFVHASPRGRGLAVPRRRGPAAAASVPPNPYFDFWAWSCRALEWCGPCPASEARPRSHHVLPVLMHHFGCAVPSYEALEVLRAVADGRPVADVGSGNGYWAFMLRQHGVRVVPVDNAQSEWRANWVFDTVIADGAKWLASPKNLGGKDMVLLMVYPIVGGSVAGGKEGGFTRGLMGAYKGDTVAVVGTQNRNGYTGFRNMTFDEYMEKEQPEWTKVVQIPIPSFAGKDEALYIYQRGERAPRPEGTDDNGV